MFGICGRYKILYNRLFNLVFYRVNFVTWVSAMALVIRGIRCCILKQDPVLSHCKDSNVETSSKRDEVNKLTTRKHSQGKGKEETIIEEMHVREETLHVAQIERGYRHDTAMYNSSSILSFMINRSK